MAFPLRYRGTRFCHAVRRRVQFAGCRSPVVHGSPGLGPWAALTAGLLYASAPYGVLYSRSIWSQDLMAPLAILWAWLGLRALNTRHGLALALHIALAGLAWQVHYSGAALIPVTAYLLVRFRLWRLSSRGTGWR